jgi:hypothetical protein
LRAFLFDENLARAPLYLPAFKGTQRRRAHRFTAAQIEAGVMPRASHGFAGHDPVGKRSVIVAAMRPDCE